ncbi:hypothetical protein AC1031_010944 [Aphanomyces cochlioides]|nr:hypothetical protein AC1031_010944 [Aphanomyces cochlioides]
MSRWTSDDDMALLVQANNKRPFLHERVMKAWDELAINLLQVPDGKKASHRFHLLLDNHEKFQKESIYMSGVDQEHNDRHILLDELLALRTDSLVRKKSKQQANAAEREEKSRTEDAARHIRDQAMKTCQKKRKAVNHDKDDKPATPSKKTLLVDFHNEEVQLERERLAFKKEKLKLEIEEKRLDRLERHEIREKELKQLEDLHNQMSEVLALARAAMQRREDV